MQSQDYDFEYAIWIIISILHMDTCFIHFVDIFRYRIVFQMNQPAGNHHVKW